MSDGKSVYKGYGISLHIPEDTLNVWRRLRQNNATAPERFGVIIGSRTEGKREYWIDTITQPYAKDKATRYSFLLQDQRHQNSVDKAFNKSGGTLIYLGTWHTHPERIPTPSGVDKKDWLYCIKRNSGRQLFFVIVGLEEESVFIRRYLGFRQLKKDC